MRPRLALLAFIGGVAISITACGDSNGDAGEAKRSVPPNLITERDLARQRSGSPELAMLQWFQAAQFGDVQEVRRLSTARAQRGLSDAELRSVLRLVGPSLARPRVERVRRLGDRAALRLLLVSYRGSSERVAFTAPATLPLRKVGGHWKVDDASILTSAADAIAANRRK